jgi:nitroreductase
MASEPASVPFVLDRFPPDRMVAEGRRWFEHMARRRSVRQFDQEPPPRVCVELAIRTAATAPSAAHRQPWRFVVLDDPDLKHEIRVSVDRAREESDARRIPPQWRDALVEAGVSVGTEALEAAPYLVIAFMQAWETLPDGRRIEHRYAEESLGLACGLFVAALHWMRLVTVPFAPPPAAAVNRLLGRPDNEEPFLLFPVGYASPDATVPDIVRKRAGEILQWNRD